MRDVPITAVAELIQSPRQRESVQRLWHGAAERLGGRQVDDEVELGSQRPPWLIPPERSRAPDLRPHL